MAIESPGASQSGMKDARSKLGAQDQKQGGRDREPAALAAEAKTFRKVLTAGDGAALSEPTFRPVEAFMPFLGFSGIAHDNHGDQMKASPEGDSESLSELVNACVTRLLVADELSSGQREVRIELGDAVLPGLSIRVFELQGNLVACFVCASDAVQSLLGNMSRDLARNLAGRLKRDVLVQVRSNDDQDPRLTEALAHKAGLFP